MRFRFIAAAAIAVACTSSAMLPAGADPTVYRRPPAAIEDVLRAPALPVVTVMPGRTGIAVAEPLRYPPVADLARPMLRLAGLRIDPATNGIHHAPATTALRFERIADGRSVTVALPPGAHVVQLRYSADGRRFAAANATAHGTELWTGTVADGRIARVPGVLLNTIFPNAIAWLPDGRHLVVRAVARRGAAPADGVAGGPAIQETSGSAGQIVTYEDLLASPRDEALFTSYATSQPVLIDAATRTPQPFGSPGLYTSIVPSPAGDALLVQRLHGPYSYLFPWERFPTAIAVTDLHGRVVRTIVDRPLQDRLVEGGVPTGPREVSWRADAPHTLTWFEARDGGDPSVKAALRDAVVQRPLDGAPAELATSADRARELLWIEGDPRALLRSYDRESRITTTALLDARTPGSTTTIGSLRDGERYRDPGLPVTTPAANGETVALRSGNAIWLRGAGFGPEGTRPFLDRYDLVTRTAARVFRSELLPLQTPVVPLDDAGSRILVQRQSPADPPNYLVHAGSGDRALTAFADPAPVLRRVQRRLVTYKRPDGVDLSFTLYLPPDYKEGTRLPTFLWAYPLEFNDRSVASQNANTTQTFVLPLGASEQFLALAGYAVLDNAAIPIVGDPRTVNDTYVEQLTAGAKAAIDEAVRLGVTDPDRVAVGGHSYGAFMTMNLLAHTRLFKAGIARSGAYNRTLTPFGFQSERRTYWEAPDLYTKLSPFTYANAVKDPVLMIHGMADDNTGTFPIQSERMFAAIKGNGGTARLVMLPYEAHGYVGRESIETTLAEMTGWLDRWIGNKRS